MCDPVTIGAAVVTAAGAAMQMAAQAKGQRVQAEGMNQATAYERQAREAERVRQQEIQKQGAETFDETRGQTTREARDVATNEAVANRTEAYNEAVPAAGPGDYLSGQGSAPSVIRGIIDNKVGDAVAAMRGEAGRRATLNAYGDVNQQVQQNLSHGVLNQGTLSGFGRGSAAVLPYEQNAAKGWSEAARVRGGEASVSPVGNMLVAVGSAAAGAGGGGRGPTVTWGDVGNAFNNPGAAAGDIGSWLNRNTGNMFGAASGVSSVPGVPNLPAAGRGVSQVAPIRW